MVVGALGGLLGAAGAIAAEPIFGSILVGAMLAVLVAGMWIALAPQVGATGSCIAAPPPRRPS
ncbi:MAG: hypothetical protein WC709_05040 [Thermoleophilia bacterium]